MEASDPKRIRERLEALSESTNYRWMGRTSLESQTLEATAVLIPLFVRDGSWHVILTERADDLESHSGEVSFPGGRAEPNDASRRATALREAGEEMALAPEDVRIFGILAEMPTITGFHIEAYVGEFEMPYEFVAQPEEIQTIFEAPLEQLARPDIHRLESRSYGGQEYAVHFFEHGDHTIWGATGHLLYHLLLYLDLIDERGEVS